MTFNSFSTPDVQSALSLRGQPESDKGPHGQDIPSETAASPRRNARSDIPAASHSLAYRRDVDGLRAIAVLSVLGYHLQISWLSGGFVGVDVFFVISGYLIGALILQNVKLGTFSLLDFYARRIRRIAPAFVALIVLVMLLGYFQLLPSEYIRLALSAFYATLSVSNIYFSNHLGYFDGPAGSQILLHTWSLGVEEQFYLIFPLFVLAMTRYAPKWLNSGLALVFVISLSLSIVGVFVDPQATFYLAPTRAWELLLGALLANQAWTTTLHSVTRNLLALLGLAMIGFAIIAYTVETPFPGAAAVIPCVGAALIIAAGRSGTSLVARGLSMRPVVFVGLISYSLYLWHWPVIYFLRADAEVLTNRSRLSIFLCSVALATLSWQFIEKPFRRGFVTTRNRQVVACGLMGLGTVAAVALFLVTEHGLPARFSPEARAYAAYLDTGQAHFREGSCFIVGPHTFSDFDREKCLRAEDGRPNYLLIGDSHAAQLWFGLSELLSNVHILQATTAGCRPEFTQGQKGVTSCTRMMDFMFSDYLVHDRVDRILIAARWVQQDLPGLENVLSWARNHGIPVTLFGPMVEYDRALPRILAEAAQGGDPGSADIDHVRNNTALDDALSAIASKYGAKYVSYYRLLCVSGRCLKTAPDGAPLEFDTDHLTKQGSLLVVRKLIETGQLN
jgi:peptidoglycan/LPS O-acetylase OafA/YrhL